MTTKEDILIEVSKEMIPQPVFKIKEIVYDDMFMIRGRDELE